MSLRSQILLSILGITVLAQIVFGLLAYRQVTESRGDQLTIFLQYLNRQIAEQLTLPGNQYVSEIYLEELRRKFSTPDSTLLIQDKNQILYSAGHTEFDLSLISKQLNEAYTDKRQHGLIYLDNAEYYWAVSDLPNKNYQLIMLEPAANEEVQIAATLKQRLLTTGMVILWIAVWISLVLSSRISKKLGEKNDQLKHIALHDSLTGLPNRTLLKDRLEQLLLQSQRDNLVFSLFLIDLDRFKEINDTLGHQFGDELLKMVSKRLMISIREKDSISRLGGDEFSVLLPQTDFDGAKLCAERILNAMDKPFCINNISTESKASIGIAIFPEHGDNVETLMQHADIAMYQAKKLQSGYAIYNSVENKHSMRRLKLMGDLRAAIDNKKIHVAYQPLVNCEQKIMTSVEALARWQHHELGNVPPSEFIPMAEQMGLVRLLTLQILKQVVADCKGWHRQGYTFGANLNLSTYCLQDFSLPDEIKVILANAELEPEKVEFEITETALMHDLSRAGKILNQLSEAGLQLAIDDFGTGFSSLNYLKNLPIDTIKIDKSFILDMHNSRSDQAIIKTIIELGHNLNCQVVAEGVETQQAIDSLELLGVDILQGYFYSKPLIASDFHEWLTTANVLLSQTRQNEA
ncbi:diguanylate cyclase/phosphodiesterase (GGDEF & EAL domains) with PAS/PAC sensor(s) [hydrothermal vent metagenome]|uniref:Diguanylate cyclase/phosphodiesterase (GGDEF & EAL domains) with PAS/PAC sensor(S) n=1 Tax=hydrothermal vent metagenome TaxID=652676 RepID=A0A3B0ZGN5_9ZZZZ